MCSLPDATLAPLSPALQVPTPEIPAPPIPASQIPAETLSSLGGSDVSSQCTGNDGNLEPNSSSDLGEQRGGNDQRCNSPEDLARSCGDKGAVHKRDSDGGDCSNRGNGNMLPLGLRGAGTAVASDCRRPNASNSGVGGERSSSSRPRRSCCSTPLATAALRRRAEDGPSPSPLLSAKSRGGEKRKRDANGGARETTKSRNATAKKRNTNDGNNSDSSYCSSSSSSSGSTSNWSGGDSSDRESSVGVRVRQAGLSAAPLECRVGEFVVFPTPRASPVPFRLGKILRKQVSAAAPAGGAAGIEVIVHWFTPKSKARRGRGGATGDVGGVDKGTGIHLADAGALPRRPKADAKNGFALASQSAEAAAAAAVETATAGHDYDQGGGTGDVQRFNKGAFSHSLDERGLPRRKNDNAKKGFMYAAQPARAAEAAAATGGATARRDQGGGTDDVGGVKSGVLSYRVDEEGLLVRRKVDTKSSVAFAVQSAEAAAPAAVVAVTARRDQNGGIKDVGGADKDALSHLVKEGGLEKSRKVDAKSGFAFAPQSAEAAAAAAVAAATAASAAVLEYTLGSKWCGVFVPNPAGGNSPVSDTGVENLATALLVFPKLLRSNAGMPAKVRTAVSKAVVAVAVAAELQAHEAVHAGAGDGEKAVGVDNSVGGWNYDSADDFE